MAWRAKGHGIVRWVLPAAALHAVFVLAGALLPRALPAPEGTPLTTLGPGSVEEEASVELTLLDDGSTAPLELPRPAHSQPLDAAPALASEQRPAQRMAGDLSRRDAASLAHPSQGASASSLDPASAATPPLPGEAASAPASADPASEAGPKLSLEQLAIGTNAFLDVAIEPLTKEELANARLHAALHPPSLDRQRGLGAGFHELGPVADAARRLVLDDDRLIEASAVLNVRLDAAGRVTEVRVLDASSQVATWQVLASRLAQALASAKLRTDGSQQAWDLKLRLASTVQLPSGAAPGMRIGVLGRQVAGNGGPGSTSLELSPTAKLDLKEPIDSTGLHMDRPIQLEAMLLKLRADPTDIGATARRVVEVALLSIDPAVLP